MEGFPKPAMTGNMAAMTGSKAAMTGKPSTSSAKPTQSSCCQPSLSAKKTATKK